MDRPPDRRLGWYGTVPHPADHLLRRRTTGLDESPGWHHSGMIPGHESQARFGGLLPEGITFRQSARNSKPNFRPHPQRGNSPQADDRVVVRSAVDEDSPRQAGGSTEIVVVAGLCPQFDGSEAECQPARGNRGALVGRLPAAGDVLRIEPGPRVDCRGVVIGLRVAVRPTAVFRSIPSERETGETGIRLCGCDPPPTVFSERSVV